MLERRNARALDPAELPYAPDLVVIDVSFISLREGAAGRARRDGRPLRRASRSSSRSSRSAAGTSARAASCATPDDRRDALVAAGGAARELGAAVLGFASSGLPGPKGNRESFVWLAEAGRDGAPSTDLRDAAPRREVEP